jgi:hypothetical protein
MEKLRRREERDARHTWSRVVDYCAANQVSTVLPTGRLFGRVSQKGQKKSGAAGQFCGRISADFVLKVRKRPNFNKI